MAVLKNHQRFEEAGSQKDDALSRSVKTHSSDRTAIQDQTSEGSPRPLQRNEQNQSRYASPSHGAQKGRVQAWS